MNKYIIICFLFFTFFFSCTTKDDSIPVHAKMISNESYVNKELNNIIISFISEHKFSNKEIINISINMNDSNIYLIIYNDLVYYEHNLIGYIYINNNACFFYGGSKELVYTIVNKSKLLTSVSDTIYSYDNSKFEIPNHNTYCLKYNILKDTIFKYENCTDNDLLEAKRTFLAANTVAPKRKPNKVH